MQAGADTTLAGTWTAEFEGKPLVRLELRADAGTLAGRIQLADIHLDQRGEVTGLTVRSRNIGNVKDRQG